MAKLESKQTDLWVVLFVTFAAATIITILRLLSRRLKRIPLSWDDYFALCGYAISVGWIIIIPYWVNHGLGLHIMDVVEIRKVTLEDALYQGKLLLFIAELFYAFGLFFAKVSILSLYWRMFRIFMGIFHCVPVDAFWDSKAGGYCAIEDKKFFFGTTLVHAAIDIAILILPMWQIGKLQLPMIQKAGIMVMFTFGFFICAAAIRLIVAARVFDDKSYDLTWNICDIVIWATVEVNLINVSGASSGSYPNSYGRSQTKQSIRLDTINKSTPNDESSSTHQLADSDDGGGRGSVSDFESHAIDRFRPAGNKYTSTVTGQSPGTGEFGANFGGILVKNETTVHVSKH
ncbi:hypothetical protein BFJ68_g2563 [Fusarium oxysporum]|uniref:Rhodopsin domain-containing protein n=1 Tax=Fusarium oxysporum TaxID=5507 RepID=A0A420RWJ8_FUSOX|nr:hypothetical protein BFJ68_g2563 [Fusarium oxysporum]